MLNTVILDDIEYVIMETMTINGNTYSLLSNINDEKDFCFRKNIIKDGKNYFSNLTNRDEFEKVLIAFTEKMLDN